MAIYHISLRNFTSKPTRELFYFVPKCVCYYRPLRQHFSSYNKSSSKTHLRCPLQNSEEKLHTREIWGCALNCSTNCSKLLWPLTAMNCYVS